MVWSYPAVARTTVGGGLPGAEQAAEAAARQKRACVCVCQYVAAHTLRLATGKHTRPAMVAGAPGIHAHTRWAPLRVASSHAAARRRRARCSCNHRAKRSVPACAAAAGTACCCGGGGAPPTAAGAAPPSIRAAGSRAKCAWRHAGRARPAQRAHLGVVSGQVAETAPSWYRPQRAPRLP